MISAKPNQNELGIIKLPIVKKLTALSTSSIWRKEQEEQFPKRIKLGKRSVGWLQSEILEWIAKQANRNPN